MAIKLVDTEFHSHAIIFGQQTLQISLGMFDGQYAVVLNDKEYCIPLGETRVKMGTQILVFPTLEQAEKVIAAMLNKENLDDE